MCIVENYKMHAYACIVHVRMQVDNAGGVHDVPEPTHERVEKQVANLVRLVGLAGTVQQPGQIKRDYIVWLLRLFYETALPHHENCQQKRRKMVDFANSGFIFKSGFFCAIFKRGITQQKKSSTFELSTCIEKNVKFWLEIG